MEQYVHDFPEMLSGVDFQTLEREPQSIYALSDQFKLIYLNPAWFRFAQENDGEPAISQRFPIGSDFTQAISDPLRTFYVDHFLKVLQDGAVWEHDYECSSPELFRIFHEAAYRMHDKHGILVMNSLLIETEHTPADGPDALNEKIYRHPSGLITQCAYCRRFQRDRQPDRWDWNPEWVRHAPARVSHSLCAICFDYYFKHNETAPRHGKA